MSLRGGEWLVILASLAIAVVAVSTGVVVFQQPDRLHYVYAGDAQTVVGENVYRREGCNACHTVFGNGYAYGPSLDGVGSRRSADWLHRYLVKPWPGVSARRYRAEMPAYDILTDEDRQNLVAYLQALRVADTGQDVLRQQ